TTVVDHASQTCAGGGTTYRFDASAACTPVTNGFAWSASPHGYAVSAVPGVAVCDASVVATLPPVAVARGETGTLASTGAGCGGASVCVPRPSGGDFDRCLAHPGVTSCPSTHPVQRVIGPERDGGSWVDGRRCKPCTCAGSFGAGSDCNAG